MITEPVVIVQIHIKAIINLPIVAKENQSISEGFLTTPHLHALQALKRPTME